jgi:OmpA-OmpF porin, OOP family
MKMYTRIALATVPAALLAGGLMIATPAAAADMCNPVVFTWGTGKDMAVKHAGGAVVHAGSKPCPAAAPAAAGPTAQKEYLVFFDWNKSNITPAADRTIADAVTAWTKTGKYKVVGHTDTSGSPAYNQKLSVRRAEAVKKALVAKGVAAKSITTEGKGETQLLVKTGDNVREPSNRRAQILNAGGPTS